jgi:hypothetical protein
MRPEAKERLEKMLITLEQFEEGKHSLRYLVEFLEFHYGEIKEYLSRDFANIWFDNWGALEEIKAIIIVENQTTSSPDKFVTGLIALISKELSSTDSLN